MNWVEILLFDSHAIHIHMMSQCLIMRTYVMKSFMIFDELDENSWLLWKIWMVN